MPDDDSKKFHNVSIEINALFGPQTCAENKEHVEPLIRAVSDAIKRWQVEHRLNCLVAVKTSATHVDDDLPDDLKLLLDMERAIKEGLGNSDEPKIDETVADQIRRIIQGYPGTGGAGGEPGTLPDSSGGH